MTPETANFIRGMEAACKVAAETLRYAGSLVRVGVTTEEIDRAVLEYIESRGARAACLGYNGYPKATCISINDVICHGVPDQTLLKEGDILNIDLATIVNGFFGDTSATFLVGEVSERAREITHAAEMARDRGIEAITPRGTTGDIGAEINKFVTRKGYHVVKEIGGHGIGRRFHDDPFVPSFGKRGKGERLKPFHCITVEPMINETAAETDEFDIPGSSIKWYRTADRTLSAQFEHTVLITDTGYEILTQL